MMKKTTSVIIVLLAVTLAGSTFLEKQTGTAFVSEHIHHSPVFIALWALLAIASTILMIKEGNWKRLSVSTLHTALYLILAGAMLSTLFGQHGSVTLTPGEAVQTFRSEKNGTRTLPFQLTLERFETVCYPGTRSPMDYVSHVQVDDMERSVRKKADVSMNNILKYRNYRFYQNDFDETGRSVLEVARDPWGIGFTYAGYIILFFSLIFMFFEKEGRFRTLLRDPLLKKGALAATAILLLCTQSLCANPAPRTLPRESAREMGEIYVLYNGRICPMGTLAKDFTTKLCGKAHYKGLTSEQVLCGWIFHFEDWAEEPMIKIKGKEVRKILGINGKYASLMDFADARGKNRIDAAMEKLHMGDPIFRKLAAANEKQQIIQMILNRKLLKIFPVADSAGNLEWYSQNDVLPLHLDGKEYLFIRKQLNYCQELVVKQDFEMLDTVFAKTVKYQKQHASGFLPSPFRLHAEKIYNRVSAGKWTAMSGVTIGLLFFFLFLFYSGKGKKMPLAAQRCGLLLMVLLTVFLACMFALRWIVGGHIPMAGSHDTMNLMALFVCILCLCLHKHTEMAVPSGLLMTGFLMLVSMIGGANPTVTPLMPVLSSPLLSLHVTVIMMAYAMLFFVALNSISAIVAGCGHGRMLEQMERQRLLGMLLLYPATALLAVGIFIGAVWANISWGRYWSWDPKEVWALITLFVYAMPLHDRIWRNFQKPWFFHIYCLIAFLSVLITYFGLNLILGGMHAYNR